MAEAYRSVVSIGPTCMASAMLKRAGLKAYSGPFDWIFSSFDMVRDCVETDFADFLNVDHMKPVPPHRRQGPTLNFCDHLLYKQRYELDSIFNHYDPREPERYQYLRRCVVRFRAILASSEPHLLLTTGRFDAGDEAAFDRLCALLDARYPTIDARMIRLGVPGGTDPSFAPVRDGRHAKFDFLPSSDDDGVNFSDGRDNRALAEALRRMIDLAKAPALTPP